MNTRLMKPVFIMAAGTVLVTCSTVLAQLPSLESQPAGGEQQEQQDQQAQVQIDPISEHLFPPDLVLQQAEQIQLTDKQKTSIEESVTKAQTMVTKFREPLNMELAALNGMLKDKSTEDAAVLKQLDNVLQEERKVKQLQLKLLLHVRKLLSDEQQTALQETKRRIIGYQLLQRRLQSKVNRVNEGLKQLATIDGPPAEYTQKLQTFNQHLKQREYQQAEAVLDELLLQLEGKDELGLPSLE